MDPLGNVPFFLSALRDVPEARQRTVVVRELLIALGVMTVFLFAGRFLLDVLHISDPALSIGGGVILFLIALRMVFPHPDRLSSTSRAGCVAIWASGALRRWSA
jgi:small neutral amino acid transporter SnatA (MarC family)